MNSSTKSDDPFDINNLYQQYQLERIMEMPANYVDTILSRRDALKAGTISELTGADTLYHSYRSDQGPSVHRGIENIMQLIQAHQRTAGKAPQPGQPELPRASLFDTCRNFFEEMSWAVRVPAAAALVALLAIPLVNVIDQPQPTSQLAFQPHTDRLEDLDHVSSELGLGPNAMLGLSGSPGEHKRILNLGAYSVGLMASEKLGEREKIDTYLMAMKFEVRSLDKGDIELAIDQIRDQNAHNEPLVTGDLYTLLARAFDRPELRFFLESGQLLETLRLESAMALASGDGRFVNELLAQDHAREMLGQLATRSDAYPVHVARLLDHDLTVEADRKALRQVNRSAARLLAGE